MLNQEIENIINEHNKIKQEVDSFLIKVASLSQITKEQYILYGQKIEHYRNIRTGALDKIDKLILKDNNQYKRDARLHPFLMNLIVCYQFIFCPVCLCVHKEPNAATPISNGEHCVRVRM